ncbi:MAG: endo-1,4-beta-xylanase [Pseudomonadota bacterium]
MAFVDMEDDSLRLGGLPPVFLSAVSAVSAVDPIEFRPAIVLDETSAGWTAVSGAVVVSDAPFSDTMPTGNATGTRVTIPASDTFVAIEKGGFNARLNDFMFVGLTVNFPEDFNSGKTLAVEFRSDAAGTTRLRYTFPAPQIRSGPNELLVRVDGVSTPGGGTWDDLGSGMLTTDVFTHIRVIGANSSLSDAVFELDRVVAYTGKPATPCLILTLDGAGFQSHIDLALPKLTAAGFLASVNINPFSVSPIDLATLHDAGWDVIQQGRSGDYAANPGNLLADYQDGRAQIIADGYPRAQNMFSFTNSADVYANRAVLEGQGVTWSRSGGGDWNAVTDYGSANNLSLGRFTLNNPVTLVQAQAWLDDVIANGATGVAQIHEIVAGAPGALQMDQAIFDAFVDYAKTKVDSGELIVASPTQWLQAVANRRNGTLGALFARANIPFGTTTREKFWANLSADPPRPTDDNKYMTHLAQEVTALVTENCVHRRIEVNEGQFDWSLFDRYYDLATQINIPLRYHVGLYHSGRPDWWTDETDAAGRAARYVREMMTYTAGKVYSVNVINEVVRPADAGVAGYLRNDVMFGVGNDYRSLLADLFNYAKSLNPAMEIRYNDLCHPTNRAAEIAQRQGILDFLDHQVNTLGAQIDGFGAQGHLYGNDYDSPGWDLIAWQQFLRDIVSIGIPNVYISEFDVRDRLVGTDQERLDTIATQTREFIAATLEVLEIKGFDVWGSYSNRLDVVEDYPPGRPDMLEQKPMPYGNDLERVPTIFQAWRQPILSAPSNRQPVAIAAPNLAAPQILVPPSISAPATTVGSVATRVRGEWLGYPVPAVTAGWMRDGAFIPGEVGETYTFQAGDEGSVIDWGEDASNSQGSASADSNDITVTAGGPAPIVNQTIEFGGRTEPGAGRARAYSTDGDLTNITGVVAGGDGGWAIIDNHLYRPLSTPATNDGAVLTVATPLGQIDVTIQASGAGKNVPDLALCYSVSLPAELDSVAALPAATREGTSVAGRPFTYVDCPIEMFNDNATTATWLVTSHDADVIVPKEGVPLDVSRMMKLHIPTGGAVGSQPAISNGQNLEFANIQIYREFTVGTSNPANSMFSLRGEIDNLRFTRCDMSSNLREILEANGYPSDFTTRYGFLGALRPHGSDDGLLQGDFYVTDCAIHGLVRGLSLPQALGVRTGRLRIVGNHIYNIGGDHITFGGRQLDPHIMWNDCALTIAGPGATAAVVVDTVTDFLTWPTPHGLSDGTSVKFIVDPSTTVLPTGLSVGAPIQALARGTDQFEITSFDFVDTGTNFVIYSDPFHADNIQGQNLGDWRGGMILGNRFNGSDPFPISAGQFTWSQGMLLEDVNSDNDNEDHYIGMLIAFNMFYTGVAVGIHGSNFYNCIIVNNVLAGPANGDGAPSILTRRHQPLGASATSGGNQVLNNIAGGIGDDGQGDAFVDNNLIVDQTGTVSGAETWANAFVNSISDPKTIAEFTATCAIRAGGPADLASPKRGAAGTGLVDYDARTYTLPPNVRTNLDEPTVDVVGVTTPAGNFYGGELTFSTDETGGTLYAVAQEIPAGVELLPPLDANYLGNLAPLPEQVIAGQQRNGTAAPWVMTPYSPTTVGVQPVQAIDGLITDTNNVVVVVHVDADGNMSLPHVLTDGVFRTNPGGVLPTLPFERNFDAAGDISDVTATNAEVFSWNDTDNALEFTHTQTWGGVNVITGGMGDVNNTPSGDLEAGVAYSLEITTWRSSPQTSTLQLAVGTTLGGAQVEADARPSPPETVTVIPFTPSVASRLYLIAYHRGAPGGTPGVAQIRKLVIRRV